MRAFHRKKSAQLRRPAVPVEMSSWISENLYPFTMYAIGSRVPTVFQAYARILHPAWATNDRPVRWEAVAQWSGRTLHSLAQWEFVSAPRVETVGPPPFIRKPVLGSLPANQFANLSRLLQETGLGSEWYAGFWDGYGWVPFSDLDSAGRMFLDQRTYLVRGGSAGAQVEAEYVAPNGIPASDLPTLLWPSDRSWFVASDPDYDSTLVGGDHDVIRSILEDPGFEAWPVVATDNISIYSDTINGPYRSAQR